MWCDLQLSTVNENIFNKLLVCICPALFCSILHVLGLSLSVHDVLFVQINLKPVYMAV